MIKMPWLTVPGATGADYEAGMALENALTSLSSIVSEFESAIDLCTMTQSMLSNNQDAENFWTMQRWPMMAARIGAMCIYDFSMVTQSINKTLLPNCGNIHKYIDFTKKKTAQKLFESSFPNFAGLRNASAHHGSNNDTPDKARKNAAPISSLGERGIATGIGSINVSAVLWHGIFSYTFDGKSVSYAPDAATVKLLQDVLLLWRDAFLPVEEATALIYREQSTKTPPPSPPSPPTHPPE